ncbi:hypothetical protein ACHAW5_000560 [Stephanodiscus triporus]|uniref:Thiamine-phosphate pyrophosphorylase n=1 Tax=Stephanodiscus triporus TaxID=2934178 RepID=A0ABD3NQD6_9STRA
MMAALSRDRHFLHRLVVSILFLFHIFELFPRTAAFAAATLDGIQQASVVPREEENMVVAPPAIVYTIAGSDSGGGAGIQADLKAIHAISGGTCHGCSAVTCLTAQNSRGVLGVHSPPIEFLRSQLIALEGDMYPHAVKVGMLGNRELVEEVGAWLRKLREGGGGGNDDNGGGGRRAAPLVVVDPVMISTSGHRLLDDVAKSAIIEKVFPYADLVTPNKYEAEEILGRELRTPEDVVVGAREILAMGPGAVLIKGGHFASSSSSGGGEDEDDDDGDVPSSTGSQDYLLTSAEMSEVGKPVKDRQRLCDGSRGVWLRSVRHDTVNTHGTGCTLSSSIAAAWAMGRREREISSIDDDDDDGRERVGALRSMYLVDACCVAKAYVNAGVARGVQANTVEWIERLVSTPGIIDVQLRFKDTSDYATILDRVQRAQALCKSKGARLWINDHWRAAIEAGGCFGVHLGQEDLASCVDAGGLDLIRSSGLAFGVSTHSYSELAAASGVRPSYLGPIFKTSSKDVKFDPQGLETVRHWRSLMPPDVPLVAIGGIGDAYIAKQVREAGADCAAIIGAVTMAEDVTKAVEDLNEAMN